MQQSESRKKCLFSSNYPTLGLQAKMSGIVRGAAANRGID
jgi:hypothetical protein